MQGDVSVSPANLDLMGALSNHRSSDIKPAYSGAFKGICPYRTLISGEVWGPRHSARWWAARANMLYAKAKQMETEIARLTSGPSP